MVHEIKPEGALGEVIHGETVLCDGTVKEMEVDALMSAEQARSVVGWLQDQIKHFEKGSGDEII